MSFAHTFSAQPHHLLGHIVTIEVDVSRGLHNFSMVGMASKAVDEARDRMSSAIKNSGYESPKSRNEKLVIALAPAQLKKSGAYHDLAMALGYLLAIDEISFDPENKLFIGELSLDGKIKEVSGVLTLVQAAVKDGFKEVYVPTDNAKEAALVRGVTIYPVDDLYLLIKHLNLKEEKRIFIQPKTETLIKNSQKNKQNQAFADVRGQALGKRGLEIAAVGGHNVVLYGPPGTGKTMLARAFCSLLPDLENQETIEVTGIHSIAGVLKESFITQPPLRSPHHTSSYVAIVGGGIHPGPGEITLAHRGVLFLDEFPEFDKRVLESLRQPLEDGQVHISRSSGTVTFPASCILIAAMNPCPCGFYGSEHRVCRCTAHDISRYQKKVSGPIMDRIDIWLPVEHVKYQELTKAVSPKESDLNIKERITQARSFQLQRNKEILKLNAQMTSLEVQQEVLSKEVLDVLHQSAEALKLSPRAFHRVIKVARSIADLDGREHIKKEHILEALQYRPQRYQ